MTGKAIRLIASTEELGLERENLHGQGYDGSGTMEVGVRKGASRIISL